MTAGFKTCEYRPSSTYRYSYIVQPILSYVLIITPFHLSHIEFRLLYTANEQTFRTILQWCCKTESWTVFCVY